VACLSVDAFIFVHEIDQCSGVKSNLKSKVRLKLIRMVMKQFPRSFFNQDDVISDAIKLLV